MERSYFLSHSSGRSGRSRPEMVSIPNSIIFFFFEGFLSLESEDSEEESEVLDELDELEEERLRPDFTFRFEEDDSEDEEVEDESLELSELDEDELELELDKEAFMASMSSCSIAYNKRSIKGAEAPSLATAAGALGLADLPSPVETFEAFNKAGAV
ncbi:uncharacterized protein MELLADRAFT_85033 [Melampsora larici-populina 98AG31]|uniref:Uncharacterized protein n=1 Tax=Melampsora larici-populina (strain 98AG31 / pathotype 3-4-7) TaxID=747676 RepID=F4RH32_MELLP|nr:uncharacterized protein MELLADRAFT_85033 [Melampsora larici-populina 98AG31]EGG08231.1 hypothetical protein MELLADRAFT_85033 [Melampsora larici-populina 98AG31]